MRASLIMTILALPLAAARLGWSQGSGEDPGLTALREAYLRAYNTGDAAAMAPLYVDDAVRMPYDAPEQLGRDAIVAYYEKSFASRRFDPTLEFVVQDVRILGETAIERGRYEELLTPRNGGRALRERGKYVAVARRVDGTWKYAWSIFNRDAPPAPAGG